MSAGKGKVFLVTGAGRGIGRAAVAYLLAQGACVTAVERVEERLHETLASLEAFSGNLLGLLEDAATPEGSRRIVAETQRRFGRLDVLVNNAAITRDNLLLKMSENEWDDVLDNNLKGPFLCGQAAAAVMREQGGGRIINVISASGVAGNPGQSNYAAAKAGLLGLTLTWSKELRRYNILVNALMPAAWTEMSETIPEEVIVKTAGLETLARLKTRRPAQVAPLIAYLGSDAAADVTGQCLGIAGRQLTIWSLSHAVFEAWAPADAWSPQQLAELFQQRRDLLQQPASVWL